MGFPLYKESLYRSLRQKNDCGPEQSNIERQFMVLHILKTEALTLLLQIAFQECSNNELSWKMVIFFSLWRKR